MDAGTPSASTDDDARTATPTSVGEDATDRPAGPSAVVDVGGVEVTLLGTAHVSRASADEVRERIASGRFDAVAIELDAGRHAALVDPDAMHRTDLFTVLRSGKAGAMAANLALGAFQQRLADQMGIEPGQEFRDAIAAAEAADVPLSLIDRDIGVTLARVYRNVPWWRRIELVGGLIASVLSREKIDEAEIERLKDGDVLEATFAEFAESSKHLYEPLIAERDRYMAARLRQEVVTLAKRMHPTGERTPDTATASGSGSGDADREAGDEATASPPRLLAIVGAGHLAGIRAILEAPPSEPPAAEIGRLAQRPPPGRVRQIVPWAIVALIVTGFVIGFVRDPDLGRQLLSDWVWINALGGGLGALAAAAHPVTILGTTLAAPLTSLNPTIGAGFVAAGLELWRRKPSVGDFATLRRDTTRLRGWYANRVARTLLVFLGATLGSAIATWLAGARIATRLF
ncbi:MAG: TraB/GumN family protein [Trueperaceae bacterium]